MAESTIYIQNVSLAEVLELRKQPETSERDPGGAHDPLNFFSFGNREPGLRGRHLPDSWVAASKQGADASHYLADLQARLHRGGLVEAVTTAQHPWSYSATAQRRSLVLTQEQWEALGAMAAELGAVAPTGPDAGEPSWRTLIKHIADGEIHIAV